LGAWVGVLGETSIADSGEESAASVGHGLATEMLRLGSAVAAEPGSTVEAVLSVISEFAILEPSPRGSLIEGAGRMTNVAWLEVLEILDLDSCLDVDLETHDPLEEGLVSGVSTAGASLTDPGVSGLFL
jgi:hypothetical protein